MSTVSKGQCNKYHHSASAGASEKWSIIIRRAALVVPVFPFTREVSEGQ